MLINNLDYLEPLNRLNNVEGGRRRTGKVLLSYLDGKLSLQVDDTVVYETTLDESDSNLPGLLGGTYLFSSTTTQTSDDATGATHVSWQIVKSSGTPT
jgi:hypothetical protein